MWAWHAGDMGWGWWFVGPLMMLTFWGAVIWLVYTLFARPRRDDRSGLDLALSPREIAERRLAAGEIDEVEFDRIVRKLSSGSALG